ncbi:MAG: thermonuclease family protein [Candidatus Omnitrophica bacterium]|nr:thermonuclease family protein [Candidatus Omnitrophota bacterium]
MRTLLTLLLLSLLIGCASSPYPTEAVVSRVIDGDTVELSTGQHVRYLGINTPEVRKKRGGQWIYDPEPFAEAATALNRDLVEGCRVRLEYDVEKKDKYGRLLAYVYLGDLWINGEMVRSGLGEVFTLAPNTKYVDELAGLQNQARQERKGIWGPSG